jgi:LysM repeat protein
MKRLATHTNMLFSLIWIVFLLLVILPAHAQGQNLLTNPGFEGSFTPYTDATPARQVAQGWVPWYVGGGGSASENVYPEYYPASDVTNGLGEPRIRSGNEAQQYFTFFATHDGGIYQRVTGITPGAQLRFSAYVYVWSSTFDDLDLSEGDGGVVVQVGIDPTGGTNGESASIIWSPATSEYDAYNEYSITANAAANANAVTVFVRSTVSTPVQNNNIYVDDAALSVSGAQVPPTATVAAATNTQPPTATQTLPPTATIVPAATNTPPDLGIVTATPLPPATQTPVPPTATVDIPTATVSVPTATLVPVATNTLIPTFTPTFTQPPTNTTVPASATPTQEQLPPTATPGGPTLTPTVTIGGTPISNDFPGSVVHTVRAGDTVGNLATLYGSSIEAIIAVNGLNQSALIRVGQGLVIPVRLAAPATSTPTITPIVPIVPTFPPEVPPNNVVYVVQPGDTLFRLAARFNTTIMTIAQLNGVTNVNLIRIGQRLIIPSGGGIVTPTPSPTTPQTYVVQPGDTLFRIALRFRVPLRQIAQTNNIFDPNRIFVGQVLVIS